jgi:hypothetical protein
MNRWMGGRVNEMDERWIRDEEVRQRRSIYILVLNGDSQDRRVIVI